MFLKIKLTLSLKSLFYAEACNELRGTSLSHCTGEQHSFFQKNVAAAASRG